MESWLRNPSIYPIKHYVSIVHIPLPLAVASRAFHDLMFVGIKGDENAADQVHLRLYFLLAFRQHSEWLIRTQIASGCRPLWASADDTGRPAISQ